MWQLTIQSGEALSCVLEPGFELEDFEPLSA
jgi:hypothetical protein